MRVKCKQSFTANVRRIKAHKSAYDGAHRLFKGVLNAIRGA